MWLSSKHLLFASPLPLAPLGATPDQGRPSPRTAGRPCSRRSLLKFIAIRSKRPFDALVLRVYVIRIVGVWIWNALVGWVLFSAQRYLVEFGSCGLQVRLAKKNYPCADSFSGTHFKNVNLPCIQNRVKTVLFANKNSRSFRDFVKFCPLNRW